MSARRFASLALLACAAVVAAGCGSRGGSAGDASGGSAEAFRPLDVGAAVPTYAARTLTGDTVRIGADEPVTLLNVWATWCTSCREEMAALDSLHRDFGARGLRVVGVSVDDGNGERVRRFAAANHLRFTVAQDAAGDIEKQYQVVGVPTTFLVGRDGKLLWRHTGNIDAMTDEVRRAVTSALASSGGAPNDTANAANPVNARGE